MKAIYHSFGHCNSSKSDGSDYSIGFETDDPGLFKLVEEVCKHCVEIARTRNNEEKENETDQD